MIVVVIIGLLAAMAALAFTRVRQQSRVTSVENFVRQVSGAAEQYMMEYGALSVNYSQLAGMENYLKGDPLANLGGFLNLSYNGVAVTGDFSIASNQPYVFDFVGGGSLSGVW
jgi:type II secretory pathway pseudopilin PulG